MGEGLRGRIAGGSPKIEDLGGRMGCPEAVDCGGERRLPGQRVDGRIEHADRDHDQAVIAVIEQRTQPRDRGVDSGDRLRDGRPRRHRHLALPGTRLGDLKERRPDRRGVVLPPTGRDEDRRQGGWALGDLRLAWIGHRAVSFGGSVETSARAIGRQGASMQAR